MNRALIVAIAVCCFAGCDSVYHYVMFPSDRIEYTLVPNMQLMGNADSGKIRLSDDKLTVIYDAKDYKIELKYMTDYQLNTFEFPEASKSGQFSTNPFTYGDWVDPDLGYVPNRFTVFKVTIYNYAGGKINFDPENAILVTDRGDALACYGREEKGSRNYSMEAYFKRRKGTSGIDDDVFESRMGIVRRTVHYLGKPIFRGDVRDGLIVFDPLVDEVEQVKLTIKDFILGYDENNQASEFTTLNFYFSREQFELPKSNGTVAGRSIEAAVDLFPPGITPSGDMTIAVKTTNVSDVTQLMKPMSEFFDQNTDINATFIKSSIRNEDLDRSQILLIVSDEGQVTLTQSHEEATARFIQKGGFVIIDERSALAQSENWQTLNNFVLNVGTILKNDARFGKLPSDHKIFSTWKPITILPPVDEQLITDDNRESRSTLWALFYKERPVIVMTNRGYATAWGEFGPPEMRVGKNYEPHRELFTNIVYYGYKTGTNAKK
ncbi:MAG: DUF4159 domain-containing protein [Bacteroidota bacterium]